MAVEIGSLVVRGTFGQSAGQGGVSPQEFEEQLMLMRRTMIDEMRDMIEEAHRRAQER
ncbi:hypothetical protein [uncultured Roseobacter sp.]|uniref:hypothetical protein n=1 Tax=uncultured Roseobacter sp. TaxID=114847 RepID=UPI00260AC2EF|nr:hypothetical protein [uncultured Roseobacter sp.]